jgi:proteasome lid subunit RPN8/RPN11
MSIKLTGEHIEAIKQHGARTYPEECGGLLLGVSEDGVRTIREVLPLENVRQDSRHNRVVLDPRAVDRADREATKRGLGVWGYYHSHPDHPAIPSGFDLEHAPFTEWSYLIVAVRAGQAEEVRAWSMRADRSQFDEEAMQITDRLE